LMIQIFNNSSPETKTKKWHCEKYTMPFFLLLILIFNQLKQ